MSWKMFDCKEREAMATMAKELAELRQRRKKNDKTN
jgi:hypothetical protein